MNAIGVDVGGTKIAAGVVSAEGEVLDEARHPTPHSPRKLVEAIAGAIAEVGDGYEVGGCASPCRGTSWRRRTR